MKKVVNVKETIIILISVMALTVFTTNVFASGLVLGDDNLTVSPNEYENARTPNVIEQENNTTGDNTTGDNTIGDNNTGDNNTGNNSTGNNSKENNTKVYNTNNSTDLPQTGIEDYNIGILLIICIASAIFAYKKINDYKNI